jgi:hypothetical protein
VLGGCDDALRRVVVRDERVDLLAEPPDDGGAGADQRVLRQGTQRVG